MVYANQQLYYDAITANSNAADSGPFIDFMLGEIKKALEAHKREPSFPQPHFCTFLHFPSQPSKWISHKNTQNE